MSDPISIATGVIGILNAATQLSSALIKFTRSAQGAPSVARQITTEINDVQAILTQMRPFILRREILDASRASMLKVDNVVRIFSSCVLTFSELERLLDTLKTHDMDTVDRIKWAKKESILLSYVQKLQNHKASLSLILNIINAESIMEANKSTKELCRLVQDCYHDMSSRLQALESNGASIRNGSTIIDDDDAWSVVTVTQDNSNVGPSMENLSHPVEFDFVEDLQNSWVYSRNAVFRRPGFSISTSSVRATQWSVLSSLTLADISTISVLDLPITIEEVFNESRSEQTWTNEVMETGLPSQTSTWVGQSHQSTRIKDDRRAYDCFDDVKLLRDSISQPSLWCEDCRDLTCSTTSGEIVLYTPCLRHKTCFDRAPYCEKCSRDMKQRLIFGSNDNCCLTDCDCGSKIKALLEDGATSSFRNEHLSCDGERVSCGMCGRQTIHPTFIGARPFCGKCMKCSSCCKEISSTSYARDSEGVLCVECVNARWGYRRKRTIAKPLYGSRPTRHPKYLDKQLPQLPPTNVERAVDTNAQREIPSEDFTPYGSSIWKTTTVDIWVEGV